MFTLFLADDHTLVRQGLRRIIEENPVFRVVGETGDGLRIAPMIRKIRPEMVVLDISMPNLRGIEAIPLIKKVDKNIKILVLTMHKNEDYAYDCLVRGAHGYVLKDDAARELIAAIESIRMNGYYISSSFSSEVISGLLNRLGCRTRKACGVLTDRERQVLKMIADGDSSKKTADKLGISVRTVEHHRRNVMRKTRSAKIADLVRYALRRGLSAL